MNSDWLVYAAVGQDYGWFLAAVGWAAAGVAWWQNHRRDPSWNWLPWCVGVGLVAAGTELFSLAIPMEAKPWVAPYRLTEEILLASTALLACGLVFAIARVPTRLTLRLTLAVALAVGAAIGGALVPEKLNLFVFVAASGLGLVRLAWPGARAHPAGWFALAGLLVTASHGPLAMWLDAPRGWVDCSSWGAVWSGGQALAAGAVWLAAIRTPTGALESARAYERRMLTFGCLSWLVAGALLAAIVGRFTRQNFETAALSRVQVAAALMDRSAINSLFGPGFKLGALQTWRQPNGYQTPYATSPQLLTPAGENLRRELRHLEGAQPTPAPVFFSTVADGWLIEITSGQGLRSFHFDEVSVLRPATPADFSDWQARASRYVPPTATNFGWMTFPRAAVVDEHGVMLGWLMLPIDVVDWTASQAQARLLVFIIVALGLGLAFLWSLQRQRIQEREAARAVAESARQADQLKTAFLAKVSHELRTPIQSILGYGELLRPVLSDPVARTRLGALRQHGELMLRLVNDLLDLSAIQAGMFRLRPRPAPLVELVRQTVDSLGTRAQAKQLAYECRIAPDVPAWALIDAERVRQVVLNLVSNAVKFTDRGGVEVLLETENEGHRVRLVVSDTGPGVPPADRLRLFQPFARLDATAAKEGSGLGLSLAAALCRSMGGAIVLDDSAGGGARFSATFRAEPCPAPEVTEAVSVLPRLNGRRILVADDNALVRELFTVFLRDQGAECFAATDGEEALTLAAQHGPDAIIVDLAMPRLNGIETIRRLRTGFGAGLRIVGVSAHAGYQESAAALAAGVDVFLAKPVELHALATALAVAPGATNTITPAQRDLMAHMREIFYREAGAQRAALAAAVQEEDFSAVRAAAHYLRNSAIVVQDEPLAAECAELERAAEATDLDRVHRAWQVADVRVQFWTTANSFAPHGASSNSSTQP